MIDIAWHSLFYTLFYFSNELKSQKMREIASTYG